MPKKKAENLPEEPIAEAVDPFIGGEEDDLSDMEYIQDETTTTKVETHPPETKAEAEALAEAEEVEAEEETEEVEEDVQPEEAEEETVETAEAEEEPEAESEVLDDEIEIKVPKNRFDEVNARMKNAEKKVEQLEKQLETVIEEKIEEPEPEPYDYEAKEKEAMEAMLEGDAEKYSRINAEIREAEKAELVREAKKLASEGDQQLQETLTFEEAAAKIEEKYPSFVEGAEGFNKEAYNELLDLFQGYARSGNYTRVQALQRAAEKAVHMYDIQAADEDSPVEEEETRPDNVVDIKKPDIKRKTKVADAQPPVMESGAAKESEPTVDVGSMSDEEYEALPESTKRRLRGDVV